MSDRSVKEIAHYAADRIAGAAATDLEHKARDLEAIQMLVAVAEGRAAFVMLPQEDEE